MSNKAKMDFYKKLQRIVTDVSTNTEEEVDIVNYVVETLFDSEIRFLYIEGNDDEETV